MISEVTYRLLVASKLKGVGKQTLRQLSRDRLFFELDCADWAENFPELKNFTPASTAHRLAISAAEADIQAAETTGGTILSWRDSAYPKLLRQIPDSPILLYVRGSVSLFTDKALAVIGTRQPTEHGKKTAARITEFFSSQGWQIVSGLAIGLDTVAHETALETRASTIAVLAHGLDTVYPRQNRQLAESILENGGLLVSEYAYGVPSFPGNFVERDRIQAALGRGVVMVQSDESGGSWHASRAALRYERWLLVPRPTNRDITAGQPKIRGNLKILNSNQNELAQFLQCDVSRLERLAIIKSKADYYNIEQDLLTISVD